MGLNKLIQKFRCKPGSDACLVVADQLEELGDPNCEIVRHSFLVEMDFEEYDRSVNRYGTGYGAGRGSGYGSGSAPGCGYSYGSGHAPSCGDGSGSGYGSGSASGNGSGFGYGSGSASGNE